MAITVYKKTALTGGAATALDGIDGAGLLDGDFAFVTLSGVLYVYILDDDEAGVESSPTRITPDANPGNKRWILQETYLKGVTSSIAELNILTGVTASAAELNLLDTSVAGTAVASKALVLGADKNIDTLSIAASGLKIGAGAGTAVTTTAAEINKLAGLATTAAELGYVNGVTSAIQTQLDARAQFIEVPLVPTILSLSDTDDTSGTIDITSSKPAGVTATAKWALVNLSVSFQWSGAQGTTYLGIFFRKTSGGGTVAGQFRAYNGGTGIFYAYDQFWVPLDGNEAFWYNVDQTHVTVKDNNISLNLVAIIT